MQEKDIHLSNGVLQVTVAVPGEYYSGQRYDWTGIVREIVLNGRHSFLSKEANLYGQCAGGIGLISQFEEKSGFGYMLLACGEKFPRIGAGVATRNDRGAYSVFGSYPLEACPVSWEKTDEILQFHSGPLICNGYGFVLDKTLSLEGNKLITACRIENIGEKTADLEEFNHNFFMIDGNKIDKDYELSLPGSVSVQPKRGVVRADSRHIGIESFRDFFAFGLQREENTASFSWTLRHKPSGVGVTETLSPAPSKLYVWGCDESFCPESFVRLCLAPGETASWRRELQFFADGDE